MNRRTVLQVAGVSAAVGLAGCIDGVQEHFGLQGVIPIEIHNEDADSHNLHIQAFERDADRDSYEESITVAPNESVIPSHLDEVEQSFRVAKIIDDELATVRTGSIVPEISLVVIRVYEDDLVIKLDYENGTEEVIDSEDADSEDEEFDDAEDEDADEENETIEVGGDDEDDESEPADD